MKIVHSTWAIFLVFFLTISVVRYITGFVQKKQFTNNDFKIGLISLIFLHTQFLLGIAAFFAGSWHKSFGDMKNSALRFITLEHPLIMIMAIVFITIGWSKHKKKRMSEDKFKLLAIFYSLGFVCVLTRVPWSSFINTWF